MQALTPGRPVPADIRIAVGTLPGRRAKEHASQGPSVGIAGQILEVFPDRTAVAQIVMAVKQALEEGAPEAPR